MFFFDASVLNTTASVVEFSIVAAARYCKRSMEDRLFKRETEIPNSLAEIPNQSYFAKTI
jgi:predicted membrane-bound mannosyltransferase